MLLCGGAVAFMYYPDLLDKLTAKPLVEEVADSDVKESVTERWMSLPVKTILP